MCQPDKYYFHKSYTSHNKEFSKLIRKWQVCICLHFVHNSEGVFIFIKISINEKPVNPPTISMQYQYGTETSQHVNQFVQNISQSSLQGNNSKLHGKIFKSSSTQTSSSCM